MASPANPLLGRAGSSGRRQFLTVVGLVAVVCAVMMITLSLRAQKQSVELLGTGDPIYATLERPVSHFVSQLPFDEPKPRDDKRSFGTKRSISDHEDRVLRKLRRLRAEQHKLEDDKQAVIDRLTKERDDTELEVGRSAVEHHKVTLDGSVARASAQEARAHDRTDRKANAMKDSHKKWADYWMYKKHIREKRLKELENMLLTGPGATVEGATRISQADRIRRSEEHCETVKKMLDNLEAQASAVNDAGERDGLLQEIEEIKAVVSTCGDSGADAYTSKDLQAHFKNYADAMPHPYSHVAGRAQGSWWDNLGGNKAGAAGGGQGFWDNLRKKTHGTAEASGSWWDKVLAGATVGRGLELDRMIRHTAAKKRQAEGGGDNQPWWAGRWNVRGQGSRK